MPSNESSTTMYNEPDALYYKIELQCTSDTIRAGRVVVLPRHLLPSPTVCGTLLQSLKTGYVVTILENAVFIFYIIQNLSRPSLVTWIFQEAYYMISIYNFFTGSQMLQEFVLNIQ